MRCKHILVVVIIVCCSTAFASADSKAPIKSASEYDYPPFSIVTQGGEADGFAVELLRAALRAVDLEVEFKVGPWDEIKDALRDGAIQVLPLVGRTPEREAEFDFTFTYLTLHGAIFVREGDTGIKTVNDLRDKEIIVMRGDNAEEYVVRERVSPHIISVETYEQAMKLLQSGSHDAVIAQRLMGIQLLKNLGIHGVIPVDYRLDKFAQSFSFAVREGDKELLALLNEGLSIVMADGTYHRLYDKWFIPVLGQHLASKDFLKHGLFIGVPLILCILIAGNLYLRKEVKRKTKGLQEEIEVRKKSEESTERLLKLNQLILLTAGEGIYGLDLQGNTTFVNPAASEMIGWEPQELLGLNQHSVLHHSRHDGSHYPPDECPIYAAFRDGEVHRISDEVFWRKDGSSFPVEYVSSPMRNTRGEIEGAVVVFRDISRSKDAEEQIRRSLKEKEILLQEVHHRVKNNFQVIMSLMRLQSDNLNDERIHEVLSETRNRVRSMSLVHEMLYQTEDLAHIDFGHYVQRLTQYMIRTYKITPDKVRLKCSIDNISLNTDTAITVGLIINELASNAMKYAFHEQGGEISIAMKPDDGDCDYELTIKDNGTGIPEGIDIWKTETLGLRMVTNLVKGQLRGRMDVTRDGGTQIRIFFHELVPAERLKQEA